jgi:murein DD-endopeptidase MepM/ murein hydrolase activator NlpD
MFLKMTASFCVIWCAAVPEGPRGPSDAPAATPRNDPRRAPAQATRLSLPFAGVWGVIQGWNSGDSHAGYAAHALDFVPAQPRGTRAPRRGAPLQAFACFGRPILAPAGGLVVRARDGQRDGPAYSKGGGDGNFVIIEHAPRELSELRHLMAGSVTVREGQRVSRGQVIGRCGNSGNAGTPHLHFALLDSLSPINTRPFTFSDYQILAPDGRARAGDGRPVKGQFLRSIAAAGAAAPAGGARPGGLEDHFTAP